MSSLLCVNTGCCCRPQTENNEKSRHSANRAFGQKGLSRSYPPSRVTRSARHVPSETASTSHQEPTQQQRSPRDVSQTWITSTVWPPRSWSMCMQHRRTNNNGEGKKYSLEIRNKSELRLDVLGYHNSIKLEGATNSPNLIKLLLK